MITVTGSFTPSRAGAWGFLGLRHSDRHGSPYRTLYWKKLMGRAITMLRADERGGVLVEATVMLVIFFVFVLGSVDFLMAMYQWNAATKAVQLGGRIASVSSPVSSDLSTLTGLEGGADPGVDPFPYFIRTCNGATASLCRMAPSVRRHWILSFSARPAAACARQSILFTVLGCEMSFRASSQRMW